MRHLDRLTVEVQVMPATDIPGNAIPQMVELATQLGCDISARCNGVKIIALPGDDPEELAAAWEWESGSRIRTRSPPPTATGSGARAETATRRVSMGARSFLDIRAKSKMLGSLRLRWSGIRPKSSRP